MVSLEERSTTGWTAVLLLIATAVLYVLRITISHTARTAEYYLTNSLVLPNSSAGVHGEADVRRTLVLGVLRLQQVAVKELLALVSLGLVFGGFTDCSGCGGVSLVTWLRHADLLAPLSCT